MISFTVDTSNASARIAALEERMAAGEKMRAAFFVASQVYLGFIRNRFVKAARGDGTWAPLAESTKLRRLNKTKKGKATLAKSRKEYKQAKTAGRSLPAHYQIKRTVPGSFEILRDTGILLNSLSTGNPGNITNLTENGVIVGTAVQYAKYHQNPKVPGRPPQRTILVSPDDATMALITRAVKKGVADTISEIA